MNLFYIGLLNIFLGMIIAFVGYNMKPDEAYKKIVTCQNGTICNLKNTIEIQDRIISIQKEHIQLLEK